MNLDMNTITLDEAELVEEAAGIPFGEAVASIARSNFSVKTVRAFALLAARRDNPDATLDDLPDDLTVRQVLGGKKA